MLIIICIAGGGYFLYQKVRGTAPAARSVLTKIQRGTVVSYISGTGQVSVSNQVDIKSKVSGDAVYVGAKAGDSVNAGAIIVQLDSGDAEKTVRDAQANLDSADLAFQKLKQPADDLTLLQAEHALSQAKEAKQNAQDDLLKAYDNGFNTVASAFFDLSPAMTGLQNILFGTELSAATGAQSNLSYYTDTVKNYDGKALDYKNQANDAYAKARRQYDANFQDYKSLTRFSDAAAIDALINETYDTARGVAESLKTSNTLIQFYEDKLAEHSIKPNTLADTHLTGLDTYTKKISSQILSLFSIKTAISADREAIINADRSIAEKTASLKKIREGADALDIASQELVVRQKVNALRDAQDKLSDYSLRAPFDGVVAKINIKKADAVSAATVAATIITRQQMAEISMNEVDVAKVKAGDKATLTFDALANLNMTGAVAEIDTIGTMSQGVVSYTVKIGFDTQDSRIKPGMTVSASIITDAITDALYVQNSAIKSQSGMIYVEVPDNADILADKTLDAGDVVLTRPTSRRPVETGITNDEVTEILSGLAEGDIVVARTIAPVQTSLNSSVRFPGLPGAGGGNFRTGTGGR